MLIAAASLACLAPAHALAPGAVDEFAQLQEDLRRAHAGGDAGSYLAAARAMYAFLHGSPQATLQRMSAESFAGNQDDALQSFAQFVNMGQANDGLLRAKQFDALRATEGYQAINTAMEANSASISIATKAFDLNEKFAVPEDVDYDSTTRRFYFSSVLGKRIVALDRTGQSEVFAEAPDQWPVMALKIDAGRRILWATEVALQGFSSVAEADWGRSAIVIYDLHSGALLRRIEGPPRSALGDMTLDARGNAIVSDGEGGGVYRVMRNTWTLQRIDSGDFLSPQTPVVLPDGRHVLIPDYVRGVGMLDLKTKRVAWLAAQGMHALSGIDGLYLVGNTLIATQNGASPERVVRFVLDASKIGVLSESIIERSTPTLGDPTHGVVVGPYFYYIADSGWGSLDEHGNLIQDKTLPVGRLMRAVISRVRT